MLKSKVGLHAWMRQNAQYNAMNICIQDGGLSQGNAYNDYKGILLLLPSIK